MKKSKLLILAVAVISIVIMATVGVFSVSATPSNHDVFSPSKSVFASEGFGSHDKGVSWSGHYFYYPSFEVDRHMNLNFEKGLEGWIVGTPAHGKLKVDSNGNKCVTMVTEKSYDAIWTIMFPIASLKEGNRPTVMYKWRGDSYAMQVTMQEVYSLRRTETGQITPKYLLVGAHEGLGATHLWKADEDNPEDWNITFTVNKNPVAPLEANSQTDKLYYAIKAEAMGQPDLTNGMDVDDFQVVIHNDEQRKVYDLDGKLLYDLNNLPKRKDPDYDFAGLEPKDENAKIKVDIDKLISGKATSNGKNQSAILSDDSDGIGTLTWIIIAGGVILILAAAAAVTVIVIKKRQKLKQNTLQEFETE